MPVNAVPEQEERFYQLNDFKGREEALSGDNLVTDGVADFSVLTLQVNKRQLLVHIDYVLENAERAVDALLNVWPHVVDLL